MFKTSIESHFGPKIIPRDAQTLPQPPYILEPPKFLFYGWVLEPELFGGDIALHFKDGTTETYKRPTTNREALKTFQSVAIAMVLDGLDIQPPTDARPPIASFAEADRNGVVRSWLNGGDKIPAAADIQKLQEALQLVKKPEWIETTRWSATYEAFRAALKASVPPLSFTPMSNAEAQAEPAARLVVHI
ncbi:hypothetical protein GGX14DRAFT_603068 [Mycena pura]|uniref:Uncharacterized protein n=1 Tax=Mycena pura TaxID=153505 RepID=A0AAD6Y0F1_9AGAR|nr:hypothetical protein GGX14DRAFT_603068 [Mycena pura]